MSYRMRATTLLIVAALLAGVASAQDSARTAFRIARDGGCMTCHDVESTAKDYFPKAPSFQDGACRYRSDPNAPSQLASTVRDGSAPLRRDRHWTGKVAFETMYPNDLVVTEAEAPQIVDWMLTLCPNPAPSRRG